jgi:hypothetical protein
VAVLVAAVSLTITLISVCGLEEAANRDSVRALLRSAEAQGYGALPVFQLHQVERTAEFYAAGRLAYDVRGEPVKFEGAGEVLDAARRRGGAALVLVPPEYSYQLLDDPRLESRHIAARESVALIYVRAREP